MPGPKIFYKNFYTNLLVKIFSLKIFKPCPRAAPGGTSRGPSARHGLPLRANGPPLRASLRSATRGLRSAIQDGFPPRSGPRTKLCMVRYHYPRRGKLFRPVGKRFGLISSKRLTFTLTGREKTLAGGKKHLACGRPGAEFPNFKIK